MKSGLVDIHGTEISVGDKLKFVYVDPVGKAHEDTLDDGLYEVAFEQGTMVAKYISGHFVEAENPRELRSWMRTEEGPYISNYGPLTVYTDNVVHAVVVEKGPVERDADNILDNIVDTLVSVYKKPDGSFGDLHPAVVERIKFVLDIRSKTITQT